MNFSRIIQTTKQALPLEAKIFLMRTKRIILHIYFRLKGFKVLTSFSQQLEDVFIYNEFSSPTKQKKDLYLIEVGALDGVRYSNTLTLERAYNLKSILIEPNPKNFKRLLANRPKSICHDCAISDKEGTVKFTLGGAVGGITEKMSEEHKKSFARYLSEEIVVKAIPLKNILELNSVKSTYYPLTGGWGPRCPA